MLSLGVLELSSLSRNPKLPVAVQPATASYVDPGQLNGLQSRALVDLDEDSLKHPTLGL